MNISPFKDTLNMFRDYTKNFNIPLAYDEWMAIPDDYKAAVLYVQFYEQITLAWYKTKSIYSSEADGVSEVLQYLIKNVEKIKNDGKRFTPAYMYRVAYNCLYCLCRDPNLHKRIFEHEISNVCMYGDDELDLFDTVKDNRFQEMDEAAKKREYFWSLIEDLDKDVHVVVAELLDLDYDIMGDLKTSKRTGKSNLPNITANKKAKISDERKKEIIQLLATRLESVKDLY